SRPTAPGGTRDRIPRCVTAARSDAARRRRAPARSRSDREALAALVAPALERQPPGARLHAGAEAVHPRALALLGLIGALHGRGDEYSGRPFFPPNAPCPGRRPRRR